MVHACREDDRTETGGESWWHIMRASRSQSIARLWVMHPSFTSGGCLSYLLYHQHSKPRKGQGNWELFSSGGLAVITQLKCWRGIWTWCQCWMLTPRNDVATMKRHGQPDDPLLYACDAVGWLANHPNATTVQWRRTEGHGLRNKKDSCKHLVLPIKQYHAEASHHCPTTPLFYLCMF